MKVRETELAGVLIIEPRVFKDHRGFFLESFRAAEYGALGLPPFVQDNVSFSKERGVLRGLHYQVRAVQGKLVQVFDGEIFDVAVDVRRGSPTFGKWVGATLSAENHRQLYIPEGFAHGFCVTGERALVCYKCSDYYSARDERGIRWDDPGLKIEWPVTTPILSQKDQSFPELRHIPEDHLLSMGDCLRS